MDASYPRKYYLVAYENIESIPRAVGNVIATYDADGFYYDVPGNSDGEIIRRKASGIEFVGSLNERRQEPGTVFVVNTGSGVDENGNSIQYYAGYCWDGANYFEIFNNLRDFQVKSVATSTVSLPKTYLVGTQVAETGVGTLIKNSSIYINQESNQIHADLDGNAATATSATSAVNATNATYAQYDTASTPNAITSYLHSVSSSTVAAGTQISFTDGAGNSSSVTAIDTTYSVFDSSTAGLVDKTSTTVNSDTSGLILCGDGWISTSDITLPAATSAVSAQKDGENQVIASTYVKSASYDTTDQELTLTYGDDTTSSPISIPNTTYSVFTTSAAGLVPAASASGDTNKFLKGDGTWSAASNYQGATAGAAGTAGLVPPAAAGQISEYLRGDGTWGGEAETGVNGLVPGPLSADDGKFLKYDDTSGNVIWDTPISNTAGSTQMSAAQISSAMFIVGAPSQGNSVQTYSDNLVYIQNQRLYQSDGASTPSPVAVVDVSSSQALTNKTYEGMTLGTAAAGTIASSVTAGTALPTNNAVIDYVSTLVPNLIGNAISGKVDNDALAPVFSESATYAVDDWCIYTDSGEQRLYRCKTAVTTVGPFDDSKWDKYTVIEAIKYLIQNS